MFQIAPILIAFFALVIPMGKYLYHIAAGKRTFADPVFNRINNGIYRVCGIDKAKQMSWKQYVLHMLGTNLVMVALGYLILRIQSLPVFNPNRISGMAPDLSFNTAISFITNTNIQHYAGESGLSYWSQMLVITFMMFVSAATGYSVCMAFARGFAGKTKAFGNFYVDLIRIIIRVLLPLSILLGLILVSQGVPQNLSANVTAATIEGKLQDIPMGPVASLEIIKHLGTNGGGFFGANSSAPFENPNVFTNIIEMLSMMLLPGSCAVAFGHMVKNRKKENQAVKTKRVWIGSQAKPIIAVMTLLLVTGIGICYYAESAGNPMLAEAGLNQSMGNMEGKETRFGIVQSSLFTTVTTAFTTGSVNNMHDTLTPLGGTVPLVNMMLNMVFGGKGVGLMNIILYAILAVFICGLMIGRTPEYLGKKIEGKEMKLTALGIVIHPLLILTFTALAVSVPAGLEGISNPGHHGFSQVLYEYTSSAANNGSGFEGLNDNTLFWNISTGLVMFVGRYLPIVISLAIAGSLLKKAPVAESAGTLKTTTPTFAVALLMVIILIAALTFFPALVLGPIAEHLTLAG